MTENIAEKTCTPCRGGIPPLTKDEAAGYLSQTPGWDLLDDGHLIRRKSKFDDFKQALAFADEAGWRKRRDMTPTSASAGAMQRSRCRPTRIRACMGMISCWRRRSTTCRGHPEIQVRPACRCRLRPAITLFREFG
jgi:hypothetical protein